LEDDDDGGVANGGDATGGDDATDLGQGSATGFGQGCATGRGEACATVLGEACATVRGNGVKDLGDSSSFVSSNREIAWRTNEFPDDMTRQ